ncbi:gamma-glutamyltransferase [Rhodoplanes azumiensis]|uniref:Glutathione hydrolase proenzyme n=1 Tax=Rhodoplanes azumiensis TaxID=1897628 RepID=A0ABW5AK08_9BRAD
MDHRFRDFERPGRSEALGADGMVATSHPAATLAGLDVLRAGGNAVDAAVCAAAMQAVVEPTQTGIGGDCFVLLMRAGDAAPVGLNGSGSAPAGATRDSLLAKGLREIPVESPHAVTIPGAIGAWERLVREHGRFDLARLLAPAIAVAEAGCPVPERLARDWGRQVAKLRRNPAAAAIFLVDGAPPRPGTIHRQPLLAATLRAIARDGAEAFYRGPVAAALVRTLRALGGVHTADDFAGYAPEPVTPISVRYRGYDVWECPPNGQGVVPLMMLNVLDGFDLARFDPVSTARYHLLAEIGRQAYAERDAIVGDPRSGAVPVARLLSEAHAATLRARVSPTGRIVDPLPPVGPVHRDTVFIAAVDRDRNAVALINSIYEDFGSGIVCPETGVVLHNRACGFVLEEGHPNALAPGKRPLHTIIPAMLSKDGEAVMPFGVTGAQFQPFGQVQVLSNILDHGLPVQQAIDLPRMFARGDTFEIESTVPEHVAEALRALGHTVTRPENPLGTAQAIWIDRAAGVLRGGADPRRDGLALGY